MAEGLGALAGWRGEGGEELRAAPVNDGDADVEVPEEASVPPLPRAAQSFCVVEPRSHAAAPPAVRAGPCRATPTEPCRATPALAGHHAAFDARQ